MATKAARKNATDPRLNKLAVLAALKIFHRSRLPTLPPKKKMATKLP